MDALAPFRQQITLYKTIAAAAANVHQRYAWWPCRKGCAACCSQHFRIAENEWLFLRLGMSLMPAAQQEEIRTRARAKVGRMRAAAGGEITWDDAATAHRVKAAVNEPCPFLSDEGACLAYDVRPGVCRLFGYGAIKQPLDAGERTHIVACSIVTDELAARQQRGERIQLPDVTVLQQQLHATNLGDRKTIAEWAAEA
jgi:Fe-S-cluster containining protein